MSTFSIFIKNYDIIFIENKKKDKVERGIIMKIVCDICGIALTDRETVEQAIRIPICPCCCSIGSLFAAEKDDEFLELFNQITKGYE